MRFDAISIYQAMEIGNPILPGFDLFPAHYQTRSIR